MNLKQLVAQRLKNILLEKGLTQYSLYRISGVPQSTISTILNGNIKTIKLSTLHEICAGLNMTLFEFFDDESLKNRHIEN